MKEIIRKEHEEITGLLEHIEVTLKNTQKTGFFEGIEAACTIILERINAGGKLIAVGNGGSAAIASHMVLDAWKNGGIKSLCFSDDSLLTCIANDYGYEKVFSKPVEFFGDPADVLTAISSSGKSLNILNAADAMTKKGGAVITLSGFNADNPLRMMGEINFFVSSGEYGAVEVIHQYICHLITDVLIKTKNVSLKRT